MSKFTSIKSLKQIYIEVLKSAMMWGIGEFCSVAILLKMRPCVALHYDDCITCGTKTYGQLYLLHSLMMDGHEIYK